MIYRDDNRDLTQRYYVFAYHSYYPSGGLADIEGTCDTVEEVNSILETVTADNAEVLDRHEGKALKTEYKYVVELGYKRRKGFVLAANSEN